MNSGGTFYDLKVPSLDTLSKYFLESLKDKFDHVSTSIVDCPDFTKFPYQLAAKGICGNPTIADVGGFGNLLPLPNLNSKFDMLEINNALKQDSVFICGAGAGPYHEVNTNCEMVANLLFQKNKVSVNNGFVCKWENNKNVTAKSVTSKFALLGQFLCSEGKSGKVLNINLRKRKCDGSIVSFLQQTLNSQFKNESDPVGLGGVIFMKSGQAKIHVMPPFSKDPLDNPAKVNEWLKFQTVSAPFVAMGECVSHDPKGLDLRLDHFHGFTSDGKYGGHFHYDELNEEVEYNLYLVVANKLLRQSQPGKN